MLAPASIDKSASSPAGIMSPGLGPAELLRNCLLDWAPSGANKKRPPGLGPGSFLKKLQWGAVFLCQIEYGPTAAPRQKRQFTQNLRDVINQQFLVLMLKMVNYPNFEHTITPHFLKLPFRRREASFILTYFHVSKLDSVLLNPLLLFYFLDPVGSLVSTLLDPVGSLVSTLLVSGLWVMSHFFKICLF